MTSAEEPLRDWIIDTKEAIAAYPGRGEGLIRDLFRALASTMMQPGITIDGQDVPLDEARGLALLPQRTIDLLFTVFSEYLYGERVTAAARSRPANRDERVGTLDEAFCVKRRRPIPPTCEDRFGRIIAFYVEGSRRIPKGDRRERFGCLRLPGIPEDGLLTTTKDGHPSVYEAVAAFMRREYGLRIKGDRVRQVWRSYFSERPKRKRGDSSTPHALTDDQQRIALRIVTSEVKHARLPKEMQRGDLVSPAWLAAHHAIGSFSPAAGAGLATWIRRKVKWAIQDEIRNHLLLKRRTIPRPAED